MSYCRWGNPVPEMTPDVDLSNKKMVEIYEQGGYSAWKDYKERTGAMFSEAYVYERVHGGFICQWQHEPDFVCDTPKEMADYLTEQKAKGKLIPQSAIDCLYYEVDNYEAGRD